MFDGGRGSSEAGSVAFPCITTWSSASSRAAQTHRQAGAMPEDWILVRGYLSAPLMRTRTPLHRTKPQHPQAHASQGSDVSLICLRQGDNTLLSFT